MRHKAPSRTTNSTGSDPFGQLMPGQSSTPTFGEVGLLPSLHIYMLAAA